MNRVDIIAAGEALRKRLWLATYANGITRPSPAVDEAITAWEAATTSDVAPWAAQYVGIPFVLKGRDHAGVDCYGLIHLIYREQFKVELPRLEEYTRLDPRVFLRLFKEQTLWRQATEPQIGDVVQMHRRRRRLAIHFGVVVSPLGDFVHAELGSLSKLEPHDGGWYGRVVAYWRHRGGQP